MKKTKSGIVAAIAVISLASAFVLPTFAIPTNSTQDDLNIVEDTENLASVDNESQVMGVASSPNTGVASEEKPASRINNTGLLITIAALSVILSIYSLYNIFKHKK